MKKKTIIWIFISFALLVGSQAFAQGVDISGFARNYTGFLMNDASEFSIVQNTFNLNFEQRTDKVGFKVNPVLYHYFDKEIDFRLREAYLDAYFPKLDIRIGQQQIIYGKAEGVFITDIVSPKDLSEFLLPDFDEIRMGVTAVKLNYFFGMNNLEAVWVPVFTPTRIAEPGSIWAPKLFTPPLPLLDYSSKEIKPSLENSEVFLRFSRMTSKADFELVAGYHWLDDPAIHMTTVIDQTTMRPIGLDANAEYHRMSMAGGSLSTTLGGFVIRSEAAYNHGRYFQTTDPLATDKTVKKDYLHYMVGLDYSLKGVKLSAQFMQEFIADYEVGINQEEFESTMTFLAAKDFFREKVWLELFAYAGLNKGDALIRPKISYAFADGFDLQMGANLFTGDREGRFGQYKDNSMLYWKIKYSF